MRLWSAISHHISSMVGYRFACSDPQPVYGGCINRTHIVHDGAQRFFVKTNQSMYESMFAAEAEGLLEIKKTGLVKVPEPICWGTADVTAYLVLEHVEFGEGGKHAGAIFGRQLAHLHRVTAPRFGWHRDNTIGLTRQPNPYEDHWVVFWQEHRLGVQFQLALRNSLPSSLLAKLKQLLEEVPTLLAGHHPQPALLHGDLWGGNFAADTAGQPVIFDPAVYYGDRETDLAMTELFGGFGPQFYQAYKSAYPLAAGYDVRKTLYNLYHVLNHANLFGGGYASQAERMTDQLLSGLDEL